MAMVVSCRTLAVLALARMVDSQYNCPTGYTDKAGTPKCFGAESSSDWATVLGTCVGGKAFVGTNSAPPDNADGMTLSRDKYREMCCVEPMTCANYNAEDADSAFQMTAPMVTIVGAVLAMIEGF